MSLFSQLIKPIDNIVSKIFGKSFLKHSKLNRLFIVLLSYVILRTIVKKILGLFVYRSPLLENFGSGDRFVLYHMDTCGHCKNMMPAWDSFTSEYNGSVKKVKNQKYSRIILRQKC